jgi:integrase
MRTSSARGRRIQLSKYLEAHYEARIASLSPNARLRYRSQLRTHIVPAFGRCTLARIDEAEVQRFLADRLKAGLAPTSVASAGRLLLRILAVADDQGYSTARVDARRIQWPKSQAAPRESRCFSAEEVDKILAAAVGWARVLWCVLAWQGLRVGEGLGLDWSHVDFDRRMLYIRQQASHGELRVLKSHTSRADLPLDPRLGRVLADYHLAEGSPSTGLLFGRYGAPRSTEGITNGHLTPLLQRIGVPHGGPHSFRHSFCRSCWAAGLDAETVRRLMRHATLAQTLRYSHVSATALRAGIDRVFQASGAVA